MTATPSCWNNSAVFHTQKVGFCAPDGRSKLWMAGTLCHVSISSSWNQQSPEISQQASSTLSGNSLECRCWGPTPDVPYQKLQEMPRSLRLRTVPGDNVQASVGGHDAIRSKTRRVSRAPPAGNSPRPLPSCPENHIPAGWRAHFCPGRSLSLSPSQHISSAKLEMIHL